MIVQYKDPPISYDRVTNRRKVSQTHFHYQHELYYLLSGETKYFVGDEIYHLHPGDFIFVPKEIIHKTDSESCLQNERILLSFDDMLGEDMQPVLEEISRIRLIHIPQENISEVELIMRKIQQEFEQDDPYRDTLVRLYILELLTLLCRLKCEQTKQLTESERMIEEITEYIKGQYGSELPLCDLSRKFGLSASCLSRKFKAATGIGISEYITNVRIHNAEQLLSKGKYTVTQVAQMCGYSDSNYFAAVFKKIKGITPLKFSKSRSWTQE